MDILEYASNWAKSDTRLGRIMLPIGIILAIAGIFILKDNNDFLQGIRVPYVLATVIMAGYGGFLSFGRLSRVKQFEINYAHDPAKALEKEFTKAQKDHRAYSRFKPMWAVLIGVCLILLLIFKVAYFQGLFIALIVLFASVLTLDINLHRNLKPYHSELSRLLDQ